MLQGLVFYVFATVAVLGAAMVVSSRNPVHSVLWLILVFFNAAGLFVTLGAEFLAMILLVVYVGAVAVLFLFVVMMLDLHAIQLREGVQRILPLGAIIGVILLTELGLLFGAWEPSALADTHLGFPAPDPAEVPNTQALGQRLYTEYAYLFLASGLILLVAMIGSIMLTHRVRPGVRKQNIAEQVNRRVSDTLEIRKVGSGEGIS